MSFVSVLSEIVSVLAGKSETEHPRGVPIRLKNMQNIRNSRNILSSAVLPFAVTFSGTKIAAPQGGSLAA